MARAGARQQLRIIGGQWRGRKLGFPPVEGLRPSPDRIRETLFNWLAPVIAGSRCLDLFAGSGALGFEALSRGAAEVLLVDRNREVVNQLQANAVLLKAEGAQVQQADGLQYLQGAARPFDIVFLDPPFRQGLLNECLALLAQGWLAPQALIYLEAERELQDILLPPGWELYRSKQAGQIGYHLAKAAP